MVLHDGPSAAVALRCCPKTPPVAVGGWGWDQKSKSKKREQIKDFNEYRKRVNGKKRWDL